MKPLFSFSSEFFFLSLDLDKILKAKTWMIKVRNLNYFPTKFKMHYVIYFFIFNWMDRENF